MIRRRILLRRLLLRIRRQMTILQTTNFPPMPLQPLTHNRQTNQQLPLTHLHPPSRPLVFPPFHPCRLLKPLRENQLCRWDLHQSLSPKPLPWKSLERGHGSFWWGCQTQHQAMMGRHRGSKTSCSPPKLLLLQKGLRAFPPRSDIVHHRTSSAAGVRIAHDPMAATRTTPSHLGQSSHCWFPPQRKSLSRWSHKGIFPPRVHRVGSRSVWTSCLRRCPNFPPVGPAIQWPGSTFMLPAHITPLSEWHTQGNWLLVLWGAIRRSPIDEPEAATKAGFSPGKSVWYSDIDQMYHWWAVHGKQSHWDWLDECEKFEITPTELLNFLCGCDTSRWPFPWWHAALSALPREIPQKQGGLNPYLFKAPYWRKEPQSSGTKFLSSRDLGTSHFPPQGRKLCKRNLAGQIQLHSTPRSQRRNSLSCSSHSTHCLSMGRRVFNGIKGSVRWRMSRISSFLSSSTAFSSSLSSWQVLSRCLSLSSSLAKSVRVFWGSWQYVHVSSAMPSRRIAESSRYPCSTWTMRTGCTGTCLRCSTCLCQSWGRRFPGRLPQRESFLRTVQLHLHHALPLQQLLLHHRLQQLLRAPQRFPPGRDHLQRPWRTTRSWIESNFSARPIMVFLVFLLLLSVRVFLQSLSLSSWLPSSSLLHPSMSLTSSRCLPTSWPWAFPPIGFSVQLRALPKRKRHGTHH